ncbi:MAG: hypothetical protein ABIJ34_02640 [archaeon]
MADELLVSSAFSSITGSVGMLTGINVLEYQACLQLLMDKPRISIVDYRTVRMAEIESSLYFRLTSFAREVAYYQLHQ